MPQEVDAAEATVRNVGRRTQPLFGLGLVDAMPDSFFDGLAAAQPPSIRGIVNRGPVVVPNPGDPTQSLNSTRVLRFGWKGGVPSLSAVLGGRLRQRDGDHDAELLPWRSLNAFALESAPNGVAVA